jgi:hypothetical protein
MSYTCTLDGGIGAQAAGGRDQDGHGSGGTSQQVSILIESSHELGIGVFFFSKAALPSHLACRSSAFLRHDSSGAHGGLNLVALEGGLQYKIDGGIGVRCAEMPMAVMRACA